MSKTIKKLKGLTGCRRDSKPPRRSIGRDELSIDIDKLGKVLGCLMNSGVVSDFFLPTKAIPKVQHLKNALWKCGIMNVLLLFNNDPFFLPPSRSNTRSQSTRMREKSGKSRIFLLFACCVGGIDIIFPLRNACLIL